MNEPEGQVMTSSQVESSTLQWTEDRQTGGLKGGGQTGNSDRASLRSGEGTSWTESARKPPARGRGRSHRQREAGEGIGSNEEWEELKTHLEEEEGLKENLLPEKAVQVFSPAPSTPWDGTMDGSSFPFPGRTSQDYNQYGHHYEWNEAKPPSKCGRSCPSRDILKLGVSIFTSAIFCPFLLWGGFVFLPFDAPLLQSAPSRLVYTLRCSIFAATPVLLGWLVLGITRFRSDAFRPLFEDEIKEAQIHRVTVHRRFISDSTSLFLIYFLQLVVMATYLSQEHLKLVPLLTVIFAFGRLFYWAAAAFGSSIRGFGFGLSFLPSAAMMIANIYFIFTVEASGSVFSLLQQPEEVLTPPAGKQRFWG